MQKHYQFEGQDLFIGDRVRIFPHWQLGKFWMEEYSPTWKHTDVRVLVVDDFGDLVKCGTPPLKDCRLPLH